MCNAIRVPRFYFDITDGRRSFHDEEGVELGTLEQARTKALKTLGEIAKDELPDGDHREFTIAVQSDARQILLTASLSLRVERKFS
jgi:hypothetical protein